MASGRPEVMLTPNSIGAPGDDSGGVEASGWSSNRGSRVPTFSCSRTSPPRAVRRRREPRRGSKARARVVPEKIQPPECPHRDEILRHLVGGPDDEEEQRGNEGAAPVALLDAHRLQRQAGEKAVLNEVPLLRRHLVPVYGEE